MKISIEQIIKEMPKNLTPEEELRYFYLREGSLFSYNRDFLNSSSYREIKEIYNSFITILMIEEGNYQNKISATCKQFAEILSGTVNQANRYTQRIKARVIGYVEDEERHVEVVATTKEGKNYNLSKDLYKIQKGMKTKGFAATDIATDGTKCEVIPENKLKEMDEKLMYCRCGMYTDDIIDLLRKEMREERNWEQFNEGKPRESAFRYKIDFLFRYLRNNHSEEKEMQIYEIDKYYKKLYGNLITEEEKQENKLISIQIKIKKEEEEINSLLYEIQGKKGNIYCIYCEEEKTFIEISEQEIIKMQESGIVKYEGTHRPQLSEGIDR